MDYITKTLDFKIEEKTIVTIGKFDGVHRGHTLILDKLWEYKNQGYKSVVVTFDNSPIEVIKGEKVEKLTTAKEKELIMFACGVDVLIELPFSEIASFSAEHFVEEILVNKLNMAIAVVGEDCSFGYKAAGNAKLLEALGDKYQYETIIIPKLKYGEDVISSTRIRDLVKEGNTEDVRAMMRQPYFVYGSFIEHGGINFKFGQPFCTMTVPEEKVMPKAGLYYTKVMYEDIFYPSLSFVMEEGRKIETFLFEADRYISYENVSVGLFKYIRGPVSEDGSVESHEIMRDIFKKEMIEAMKWHKENIYIPEDVCFQQY